MKDADRVVFVDRRNLPEGSDEHRPNWKVRPDIQADFRELPFSNNTFDLICFDPPHRVTDDGMELLSGPMERHYGALRAESWQSGLVDGFTELWRVLRDGGVLTLKWNDGDRSHEKVLDLLPETPLYGTNGTKGGSSRWWVFHKRRE
jgi:SAM-dependent methyltransferase